MIYYVHIYFHILLVLLLPFRVRFFPIHRWMLSFFFIFSPDSSVKPESKRIEVGNKLLKLLIDTTIRADRDCSTQDAGNELQVNARKILRGCARRDEILNLLVWESFSSPRPERRRSRGFYPSLISPTSSPTVQNPVFGQVYPQLSQPMVQQPQPPVRQNLVCSFCGRFGHVENTCYQKFPEQRKK